MSIFVVAVAPITYSAAVAVLVVGHGLFAVALTTAQGLLGIAVVAPHAYFKFPLHASLLQFQLFLIDIPAGFFPSEIPISSLSLLLFLTATFSPVFLLFLFCVFPKVSMANFWTSSPASLSLSSFFFLETAYHALQTRLDYNRKQQELNNLIIE